MELRLENGDYVPDGSGGMERGEGVQAVLNRVLFRLTARRGAMPFLPELGSGLYRLMREKPSARKAAAKQYVAQALEAEKQVRVTDVELTEVEGGIQVTAYLLWQGQALSVSTTVEGV